jgi:transcription initiation factor IIE alpha subunit
MIFKGILSRISKFGRAMSVHDINRIIIESLEAKDSIVNALEADDYRLKDIEVLAKLVNMDKNDVGNILKSLQEDGTVIKLKVSGKEYYVTKEQAVYVSLENKNYAHRTTEGIAKEINLAEHEVEAIIKDFEKKRLLATISSREGTKLYSTRRHALSKALEDERFDWRTMDGLLRDTGIEAKTEVEQMLFELGNAGIAIRVYDPSTNQYLYTTRDHYNKRQGFVKKALSSLTGNVH